MCQDMGQGLVAATQGGLDQGPMQNIALRVAAAEQGRAVPHRHEVIDRLGIAAGAECQDAMKDGKAYLPCHHAVGVVGP